MDRNNRWRMWAGAMLCAAGAWVGYVTPSFAQQLTGNTPAASASLRPSQSFEGTAASEPGELRGTSFAREQSRPDSPDTGLADFDRGTDIRDDPASGTETVDTPQHLADQNSAELEPDNRSPQDRAPFEDPPAGHDPRYFRIEVEPLTDRRTRQFFEVDPYQHLGWRLGSFILFQEFEIGPAWQSNVLLENSGRSDWLADFNSETRLVSDWANHAIELRMVQDRTYHRNFTTENDAGQLYELRGRIDVRRSTNVEGLVARDIRQESRNSVDTTSTTNQPRDDVITDRVNVALNHRFNRLSVQLRGGHAATDYKETSSTPGTSRDVRTTSGALRLQWEFRPTLSVFGEFEHNDRDQRGIASTDGLSRSSKGERYRAGVALGQTGEILRGEASIGYGVQRPDAAGLPDIDALLVDANLAWRVTPLTSVLFSAATTFDDTTLTGASGVINRQLGVAVRHAWRRNLITEGGVTYGTQEYPGNPLSETNVTLKTSVEYSLNRHAALFTRYEHVRFNSSNDARDYNANTVMFGARIRN